MGNLIIFILNTKMKLTAFALAALGVEGCIFSDMAKHIDHNAKVTAIDMLYRPIVGGSVKDMCPTEPKRYSGGVYFRKVMQAMHKSGLKGMYHTDKDLVTDDCFGDWIDTAWAPIH